MLVFTEYILADQPIHAGVTHHFHHRKASLNTPHTPSDTAPTRSSSNFLLVFFDYRRLFPTYRKLHFEPRATMSSGETLKADKDFSKEVDKLVPEAESTGKVCLFNI